MKLKPKQIYEFIQALEEDEETYSRYPSFEKVVANLCNFYAEIFDADTKDFDEDKT